MLLETHKFNAHCVGVDGCKAGWVACWEDQAAIKFEVFVTFQDITVKFENALIAVDMPMGLPDTIGEGGRGPEALARKILKGKSSSIFSMISRRAIEADADYLETCRIARDDSVPPRGISKQGFNILPKVRELDAALRHDASLLPRVCETHPELALSILTGQPVLASKSKPEGQALRLQVLKDNGLDIGDSVPRLPGAKPDDAIDSAICLLVAKRIANGEAISLPAQPALDSYGIPIAIWA